MTGGVRSTWALLLLPLDSGFPWEFGIGPAPGPAQIVDLLNLHEFTSLDIISCPV